ncbi:hypothetical protein EYF80_023211 [Liparis tanakae]|uniref:Uncharacterized protein n=1 Tax=Liparis tanakae TaxID=230148 RepID=A0A4Z2HML1_9TELE|nr:hypothetical protein EYF80_023211 [Liparis tanakae]
MWDSFARGTSGNVSGVLDFDIQIGTSLGSCAPAWSRHHETSTACIHQTDRQTGAEDGIAYL